MAKDQVLKSTFSDKPRCLWCAMNRKPIKMKRQYVHVVECMSHKDGVETKSKMLVTCPESGFQKGDEPWDGHSPREWTPRRLRSKNTASE